MSEETITTEEAVERLIEATGGLADAVTKLAQHVGHLNKRIQALEREAQRPDPMRPIG